MLWLSCQPFDVNQEIGAFCFSKLRFHRLSKEKDVISRPKIKNSQK
jgi:hypothetical protein